MLKILDYLEDAYREGLRATTMLKNDRTTFLRLYDDSVCDKKHGRVAGATHLLTRLDSVHEGFHDVVSESELEGLTQTQQRYVIQCATLVSHYKELLHLVR